MVYEAKSKSFEYVTFTLLNVLIDKLMTTVIPPYLASVVGIIVDAICWDQR